MRQPWKGMVLHIPDDPEWLRAFGRVAIAHAHLDYSLRMLIRTLAGVTTKEALDATVRESSSMLRDRARRLARTRLGEGPTLLRVQAILERCKRVTDRRNDLLHGLIGRDGEDCKAAMLKADHTWEPLPPINSVEELVTTIVELTDELNLARTGGWLADELDLKSRVDSTQG